MVDDRQFTLLIIPVEQEASLVPLSPVYFREIDVLTGELEVWQGRALGFNDAENPLANVALTKQMAEIVQRFASLVLSPRYDMISVLGKFPLG